MSRPIHSIAVVVPVYLGELTLENLATEVAELHRTSISPGGNAYSVSELILVHDCGPDRSDEIIRELTDQYSFVNPIWLSRNFGQHAATLAGLAASSSDWVVTLDEDGQHCPADIPLLLDHAINGHSQLVYATPSSSPLHSIIRNWTSRGAKQIASFLSGSKGPLVFSSFRLISGELARSVAAFAGPSVYLDVALSWIAHGTTSLQVNYREEQRNASGYTFRKLLGHFWKLALTTGTRPLRLVSAIGATIAVGGFIFAGKIVFDRFVYGVAAQGWASVLVSILILGGGVLIALGVIAEYVGIAVRSSLGQPTYLTIRDPHDSPVHGKGTGNDLS